MQFCTQCSTIIISQRWGPFCLQNWFDCTNARHSKFYKKSAIDIFLLNLKVRARNCSSWNYSALVHICDFIFLSCLVPNKTSLAGFYLKRLEICWCNKCALNGLHQHEHTLLTALYWVHGMQSPTNQTATDCPDIVRWLICRAAQSCLSLGQILQSESKAEGLFVQGD